MRVDVPDIGAKTLTSSIRRLLAGVVAAGGASRATRGGIALLAVLAGGTTGYMVIEGWGLMDSVYMTVVTMTTVGYDEVKPLSAAGRTFNLFVMVGGVGLMLYILTVTVQAVVEDEVLKGLFRRRRMRTKIEALEQHYILCGYGRVGREVAAVFRGEGASFVVVDASEAAVEAAEDDDILAIYGNATHNETLRQAGIERARGLIAASGSDSENVVITLTASAINPELNIVARADDAETAEKLTMAGAGRVVTPYRIGGRRMALSAIRPMSVDFFDDIVDPARTGPRISEIEVLQDSPLAGMTVAGFAQANDARVLALCRPDGAILFTPEAGTVMKPGDGAIVLGMGAGVDVSEADGPRQA